VRRQGREERPDPIARRVDPGLDGDLSQRRDTPQVMGNPDRRKQSRSDRVLDALIWGTTLGAASGAVLGDGTDGVGAGAGALIGAALYAPAEVITSIRRPPAEPKPLWHRIPSSALLMALFGWLLGLIYGPDEPLLTGILSGAFIGLLGLRPAKLALGLLVGAVLGALFLDRGDPEVRVSELALDDDQRDAFAGHLHRVCVAQLVGARSGDALQPIRRRDEAALAQPQATDRVRGSARWRRRTADRPAARRDKAAKAEAVPSPTHPSPPRVAARPCRAGPTAIRVADRDRPR
jgi:hypothetical protein